MEKTKTTLLLISFLLLVKFVSGQDSLFVRLASENVKLFSPEGTNFHGDGWEHIKNKVQTSTNVLVGEDHFSNEIPDFFKALANITKFDNFIIEVDPYSTEIIKQSFDDLSEKQREQFNEKYSSLFSFYALKPEYELLKQMMDSGANLLGSDQIVMYADRLIFQEIAKVTKNSTAKEIYNHICEASRIRLDSFMANPQNPMYFMTPEFIEQLDKLEGLDLSDKEDQIMADMRRSVTIYKERSHKKRVKLIMHHLMEVYPKWNKSKNLFKYGANHLTRGESFLTVFDIGNLVANITESNYEESFHIMIIGESGMLGAPFESFPPTPVNIETGFYLTYLKPFFKITEGEQWHLFDLLPLRKAVNKKQLKIENLNLLRVIKGYDALVIIPEVTAAGF